MFITAQQWILIAFLLMSDGFAIRSYKENSTENESEVEKANDKQYDSEEYNDDDNNAEESLNENETDEENDTPNNNGGKEEVSSNKTGDQLLSDEEHYNDDLHNVDYDHEAFLGEAEAKTFDDLSPEESKKRLGKIVDKIDSDKDSFVSKQELKDWIQLSQKRYIIDDTERQWKNLNPNDEPEISWQNYKMLTYGVAADTNDEEMAHYQEMMARDLRRWKKADQDGNDSLTKQEFQDFIHPEESVHMKDIIVVETMEDVDKNNDGKISLEEYIGDMYNDDEDVGDEPSWVESEKTQFIQYRDRDRSGFMEFEEVKDWILPEGHDNSEAEAKHLIYESDINRDNLLSKEEILNKFDLFVGSQATDFGEALTRHDEF